MQILLNSITEIADLEGLLLAEVRALSVSSIIFYPSMQHALFTQMRINLTDTPAYPIILLSSKKLDIAFASWFELHLVFWFVCLCCVSLHHTDEQSL